MKMKKFVIFAKRNFKINMLKINNIAKLRTIVIMQVTIKVLHTGYLI